MSPLKIVIVSQNSLPKLLPRAHRTTELANELAKQGHDVTVYALLGDFDYTIYETETKVNYKNLGISKYGVEDNVGWRNMNIIYRVIGKLFRNIIEFPNIELISMTNKILEKETDIDYLITIAHPHPIHWGAAKFINKNKSKIKFWVADCGDPFMLNPFKKPPFYYKNIEKKWCQLCDFITVPVESAKDAYYSEFRDKIQIIPQGFSFEDVKLATHFSNPKPTFAYSGVVYKDKRDPSKFLEYLSNLEVEFKFIIYTSSDAFYLPFIPKLGNRIEIRNYIPRNELLYELSKMDFLINIRNESAVQTPSKLIDYAITKRPILEITSDFKEEEVLHQFLKGDYRQNLKIEDIDRYNIKNVANRFLELMFV